MVIVCIALRFFHSIRPALRQAIPAMEPAMEYFLGGHQPVLAIVIAVAGLPAIYWMIGQFKDCDRLNAEAGLPPTITWEDVTTRREILGLQRRGDQRALDAWHSQLETLQSKPG
jgi:hypothetical protein